MVEVDVHSICMESGICTMFHHDLDLKQTVPLDLMVFLESIYGNENAIKYVM